MPIGFQNWRRLLFVHWRVPAARLRPLVPAAFPIDEFDGSAFVSLVLFTVEAARPLGAPAGLGLRFLETNVRTYVRLDGDPGVYFFSLDAASLSAVVGARLGLGLPYFWATGWERVNSPWTEYAIRRRTGPRPTSYVRYRVGEYRGTAAPGSLDHFLVERYVLHVRRGPTLWSVRVRHHPYPLRSAELDTLNDQLVPIAGIADLQPSPLVHFASGVDVAIYPPRVRPAI